MSTGGATFRINKNGITFVFTGVKTCQSAPSGCQFTYLRLCSWYIIFTRATSFPIPLELLRQKELINNSTMNKELPYILLADDDPDDLNTFLEGFSELNPYASVQTVIDGQELVEFLDGCEPDELPSLIVLDYKMPILSGPEVLQRLASSPEYAHIPKVVWSTSKRSQDIENCIHLGAAGYFLKPASSSELYELIQKIELIYSAQLQRLQRENKKASVKMLDLKEK
jgi:two-component response regulator ARR-A family